MTSGIYQIINKENGKIYIGSTLNFKMRFRGHKSELRRGVHSNTHLQNAWLKYGETAFVFCILKEMKDSSIQEIRIEEQNTLNLYINKNEWSILYNIGKSVTYEGCVQSAETLKKISASLKKFYEDPKEREKISVNSKKMWQNPEHRAKMLGILNSEEKIAKNREITTKNWQNPEYRAKLVAAHSGKTTKDSTKDKLRQTSRKSGAGIRQKKTGYYVHINHQQKQIHIGVYKTYDEAVEARLNAEKYYWSENFTEDTEKEDKIKKTILKKGDNVYIYPHKNGGYKVCTYTNKKTRAVGVFKTYEEALQVQQAKLNKVD